jgi:hypothetical protein
MVTIRPPVGPEPGPAHAPVVGAMGTGVTVENLGVNPVVTVLAHAAAVANS